MSKATDTRRFKNKGVEYEVRRNRGHGEITDAALEAIKRLVVEQFYKSEDITVTICTGGTTYVFTVQKVPPQWDIEYILTSKTITTVAAKSEEEARSKFAEQYGDIAQIVNIRKKRT